MILQAQSMFQQVEAKPAKSPFFSDMNYFSSKGTNLRKGQEIFNVNPNTISKDHLLTLEKKEMEGTIKRSLNLAPSTNLGIERDQINNNIKDREYLKVGGDYNREERILNNMTYHKSNPIKDLTYNSLTGAYYSRS